MKRFREETRTVPHPAHKRLKAGLFALIAAASLSATAFAAERAATAKYAEQPPIYDKDGNSVLHSYPEYAVNKNGQTYGTPTVKGNPEAYIYLEDYPDLIGVIGDHGISGYLYLEDFIGEEPKTLEEAAAISEAQRNGTYIPRSYPVYAADGETVIDTFTPRSS